MTDTKRLRELLDEYNQTVVGPEDAAELYELFTASFYEHIPALLDAADERDRVKGAFDLAELGRTNLLRDRDALKAEVERLREAIEIGRQMLMEIVHAQESGPGWYTRGLDGMYQQVRLWTDRASRAFSTALKEQP